MTDSDVGDGVHAPSLASTHLATPFDQPGTYVYELTIQGDATGRMAWSVADVSGDESTVAFHYEFADETVDITCTDTPRAIADRLLTTAASPFLEVVFFPSILLFAEREALAVGERMTVPMPDGTCSAEITGKHVHDGHEWYTSVWRCDDAVEYTDCMAPETGLVLHAEYHEADEHEPMLGIALVEKPSDG